MATATLNAALRNSTGKGAARKLRQAGNVPAVIYGHGRDPQALTIETRQLDRLLAQMAGATTVVELTIGDSTARTLIREVQRHPVQRGILHVDFQELVAGEKVTVSIPIRFSGTSEGVRTGGGIMEEILHQIHARLDPANIPEYIEVDVTPLTLGHSFHVRDLHLPDGVEVLDDASATVCVVSAPKAVVETPVEGAEAAAVAEPELIRKTKDEEEGEAE
ncbi:MAG TPA: 50S ribosomal protein L25/general stress protein Ctc [Gemmatimonadaceae bacterium]|nr:50S ribosomal protein L25/general stress protein Ctc [Gemmatimonadaceae bacterium]